jgi:predicted permease
MLLIGAGLLIQSFRRLREVNLGFDPERVVVFRVWPPSPRYDSPAQAAALYDRIVDAASAAPGVASAAVVNHAPLAGGFIQTRIRIPGRPEGEDEGGGALYKTASARYLETMKMRLVNGRWFTEAEMASPGNGIVITDAVARRYWPNGDALGKAITIFRSSQNRPDFGQPINGKVIGVVESPRHFGLESDPTSEVYVPYTLETWPHIALVVRTSVDPASVIPALRAAVLSVDPAIPVAGSTSLTGFSPLTRFQSQNLATRRYSTWLLIAFAGSALLLAVVGVYGILAYTVARRTQEIGVRLALGAAPRDVLQLVMGQGMRLAVAGTVIGVIGAFALSRLLATLLYATSPTDPVIFMAVPTIVVATALVACLIPALRAAWLDPTVALRSD